MNEICLFCKKHGWEFNHTFDPCFNSRECRRFCHCNPYNNGRPCLDY